MFVYVCVCDKYIIVIWYLACNRSIEWPSMMVDRQIANRYQSIIITLARFIIIYLLLTNMCTEAFKAWGNKKLLLTERKNFLISCLPLPICSSSDLDLSPEFDLFVFFVCLFVCLFANLIGFDFQSEKKSCNYQCGCFFITNWSLIDWIRMIFFFTEHHHTYWYPVTTENCFPCHSCWLLMMMVVVNLVNIIIVVVIHDWFFALT